MYILQSEMYSAKIPPNADFPFGPLQAETGRGGHAGNANQTALRAAEASSIGFNARDSGKIV